MKKERPILFNSEMVNAILENRKTMTRRTRGLEKFNDNPDTWIFTHRGNDLWSAKTKISSVWDLEFKCPYGQVGDILWVRESFNYRYEDEKQIAYKADLSTVAQNVVKWKPSIHMPKLACRIRLEIKDIRVERLKNISEQNAIAEGVEPIADGFKNYMKTPKIISTLHCFDKAYFSFLSLWESINGYESSELNHWVWVITFKKVEKP